MILIAQKVESDDKQKWIKLVLMGHSQKNMRNNQSFIPIYFRFALLLFSQH